jgi:hypothetical protein
MSAPSAQARADLLLGSPSGQLFVAGCLGHDFGQVLSDRDAAPEEVRAATRAAVAGEGWRGLLDLDDLGLLATVAGAHPGFDASIAQDEGTLALLALARQELRPAAVALVSAPAARRWWDPVALADQRFLEWDGWPRLTGPAVQWAVRDSMTAARAENSRGLRWAQQHGAPARDCWWSVPEFAVQSMTTGGFGDLSAIALARFEDLFTPLEETTAAVWSVQIAPQAQVMEIAGPADWQALVSAFPQDVTGTHDGEWGASGGLAGPWRLPDWEQVMEHYDGVHLTIGGYLACGGLALPAGGGHTMLTGWIPDATLWLRDVATGDRCLGRWQGDPQGTGTWDDLHDTLVADGWRHGY